MSGVTRLAVWSGPRNISTALMRSWGQRPDTVVCDEPLYAHYLAMTGLDHPGRAEILAAHETDWRLVTTWLTGPLPDGKTVFYQKHMAHHLLDGLARDWLDRLTHVLLIREPGEMLTSLIKVTPRPTVADTGLPQQWELFERLADRAGAPPPVFDARDILDNPRTMLQAMCGAVHLPFTEAMLSWPAGPRPTDGVWAPHWYAAVDASTGFQPPRARREPVPSSLAGVREECDALYQRLHARRITA